MNALATRFLIPLALGVSDGILTALILASAAVLRARGDALSLSLACRVGVVAFVTGIFTVFVAEYAQLRNELARAERELNMTSSGRLATGHLGRAALREAAGAAAVASVSSFFGAAAPLLIGAGLRSHPWIALVIAVAGLGGLGAALAGMFGGRRPRWTVALMVGGVVVAIVGARLDIA